MYIARQPIFDKQMNVYGYELLYRSNEDALSFGNHSSESATASVLGGLFELGLHKIVDKKKAFINFDTSFLLSDSIFLIDPETLVIEVLEHVHADALLIARIIQLKNKGYIIALDDFTANLQEHPLIPSANIIKYDLQLTPLHTLKEASILAIKKGKTLLAEKIETQEEFYEAKKMGFTLFQGYFFSKPKIVGGIRAKKSTNLVYQQIAKELHNESPSYDQLSDIIGTDVNLAYRVMKTSGVGNKSKTLKDALIKMGFQELERWINVLMLQELSKSKPAELMRLSLVRSRFGEQIASHSRFASRKYEIALMCLFSVLDALLDQPMDQALEGIYVSEDVRELLVHQEGDLKLIYDIITCYEKGACTLLSQYSSSAGLDPTKLFLWYLQSIHWANEMLKSVV